MESAVPANVDLDLISDISKSRVTISINAGRIRPPDNNF